MKDELREREKTDRALRYDVHVSGQQRRSDAVQMARKGGSDAVQFLEVRGGTHFSILAPVNKLLAKKILADTDDATPIALTAEELRRAMGAK